MRGQCSYRDEKLMLGVVFFVCFECRFSSGSEVHFTSLSLFHQGSSLLNVTRVVSGNMSYVKGCTKYHHKTGDNVPVMQIHNIQKKMLANMSILLRLQDAGE